MRLVLINGPIGSGKSWIVKKLKRKYIDVGIVEISFKQPLIKATQSLLGVESMDYDEFKKAKFAGGLTGREWMIVVATRAREIDENIFVNAALNRAKNSELNTKYGIKQIFISDDTGFPNEVDVPRVTEGVDVLMGSIEPHDSVPRNAQYLNDSRFNLADKANVVAPNSTNLLQALSECLERRGWV